MRFVEFRIENYKSFLDSQPIPLKPGFNVVIGKNNVGKTALLEALSLNSPPKPHRSLGTMPEVGENPSPASLVHVKLQITGRELQKLLRTKLTNNTFYIPVPQSSTALAPEVIFSDSWTPQQFQLLANWFLHRSEITFSLVRQVGVEPQWSSPLKFSAGLYQPRDQVGGLLSATVTYDAFGKMKVGSGTITPSNDIGVQIAPTLVSAFIYRFWAERFNIGSFQYGESSVLRPDAQNLPEVLNSLQHNPTRFAQYNSLVSEVLPEIKWVSVKPSGGQNNILIWKIDPKSQRSDLAFLLSESGTGIGQILAILYVVLTADDPQTFLIDEPQSFLHPGAARKLIGILKRFPQHQFIVATHSPLVISESEPATLTVLQGVEEVTASTSDGAQAATLSLVLNEVGARLGDVFGADNLLWVEGPTEEICFPQILERVGKSSTKGSVILGVRSTGDLEGRDAERIFDIYDGMAGNKLLPPAIGFIFDPELRSDEQQRLLIRRSQDRLSFLKRRTYENYLLYADAITNVANSIENFRSTPVTEDEVSKVLESKSKSQEYFPPGKAVSDGTWNSSIHGPKLLKDIFNELSETRVAFDKIKHSTAITQWIIDHHPERLSEIAAVIIERLSKPARE